MANSQAGSLIGAPGIERTSMAFRRKLVEVAERLGVDPDYLATVISFESAGTFDPAIRNPYSGCVGLIQFCRKAAENAAAEAGLSMTAEEAQDWLGRMSAENQLDHVESYFRSVGRGKRGLTLEQMYLLVFAPSFAFSPPSSTAYAKGSDAYDKNKPMDTDGDGRITVSDISKKIVSKYNEGLARVRVPIERAMQYISEEAPSNNVFRVVSMFATTAAATYAGFKIANKLNI